MMSAPATVPMSPQVSLAYNFFAVGIVTPPPVGAAMTAYEIAQGLREGLRELVGYDGERFCEFQDSIVNPILLSLRDPTADARRARDEIYAVMEDVLSFAEKPSGQISAQVIEYYVHGIKRFLDLGGGGAFRRAQQAVWQSGATAFLEHGGSRQKGFQADCFWGYAS